MDVLTVSHITRGIHKIVKYISPGRLQLHSISFIWIYGNLAPVGWQPRQARAVPAPMARGRNGPQDHCPMPIKG